MSKLTLAIPSVGEKVTVAEPKVDTAFAKLEEWANGKVGTENIEAGTVTEAMLATAVQEKLTTKVGLTLVKQAGSTTGESEKLYLMETNATTLTLPASTLNRVVGVSCLNGIASVKVKTTAGKIYGDSVNGPTEITLLENQHVLVEADGTNWRIIAGTTKPEDKYTTPTQRNGSEEVEISASRSAHVIAYNGGAAVGELSVGGVAMGGEPTSGAANPMTFILNPGEKFKTSGSGAKNYKTQHRLLPY